MISIFIFPHFNGIQAEWMGFDFFLLSYQRFTNPNKSDIEMKHEPNERMRLTGFFSEIYIEEFSE